MRKIVIAGALIGLTGLAGCIDTVNDIRASKPIFSAGYRAPTDKLAECIAKQAMADGLSVVPLIGPDRATIYADVAVPTWEATLNDGRIEIRSSKWVTPHHDRRAVEIFQACEMDLAG